MTLAQRFCPRRHLCLRAIVSWAGHYVVAEKGANPRVDTCGGGSAACDVFGHTAWVVAYAVVAPLYVDKAKLYRGTFKIYRHITYRSTPEPPSNCLFTETERGTYTIGASTGRYAGIRGSGKFTLRITGVLASTAKGQCGRTVAFQQIMYERGPVNK